jgi:hypothetical protein
LLLIPIACADYCDCSAQSPGAIIHVDAANDPGGDGSENDPFDTIQGGIDEASDSNIPCVYVKQGTYSENITFQDNIQVYGGFPAGGLSGSWDWEDRDPLNYTTIIQADGGSDLQAVYIEECSWVVLDGFKIEHAYEHLYGIYIAILTGGSNADHVKIENNTIEKTNANENAVAIYLFPC